MLASLSNTEKHVFMSERVQLWAPAFGLEPVLLAESVSMVTVYVVARVCLEDWQEATARYPVL